MMGFPEGSQATVMTTGKRPRRAVQPDCIDCGEPITRCACVDDTPASVVEQMSVPSMLDQLRSGR